MEIDEETKRNIIDLYFNQHITIHEIAKITFLLYSMFIHMI